MEYLVISEILDGGEVGDEVGLDREELRREGVQEENHEQGPGDRIALGNEGAQPPIPIHSSRKRVEQEAHPPGRPPVEEDGGFWSTARPFSPSFCHQQLLCWARPRRVEIDDGRDI
ncbi:hypothetical protein B296_00012984 [Ensete ventricosum]|uniref:Uncharacterized protein n=1 Tax=Ensete ventricosum TaxID=4639 RepID=A0A427ARQ9_ENSVE|nr:hypothetical protein B296_00012984 [Ensete ventricosum]